MAWMLVMLFTVVAFLAAWIYMVTRVAKFHFVDRIAKGKRKGKIFVSVVLCVMIALLLMVTLGSINGIICILYLIFFWCVSELVFCLAGKVRKKEWKRYYAGAAAVVAAIVYLSFGWYQDHGVWEKDYVIHTDKKVGNIKIALLSDSHVGAVFNGEGFEKRLQKIQKEKPDVVLLAGDFVDDDTSLSDMKKSCKALGELQTKYGVYYVFGNHDKGYYAPEHRGYDGDDLVAELTKNHVKVLQDENVLLDNRFYLIGRKDLSEEREKGKGRKSMSSLTASLDHRKYEIVMDHQPMDYAAQAKANVDLVLSGHTHGGQLLFLKLFQAVTRAGGDDQIYGISTKNKTKFIVTSGIADWAIKFKTGCRSEYVMIHIQGK